MWNASFINFQSKDWPFKTTLWCLLWRNDSIRSRRLPFILLSISLCRNPSWLTLSNAFEKSRKTPQTFNDGLASNALKILWVIEITYWLTQESFGLKPDWGLLRGLFSIIDSKTSFSKINTYIKAYMQAYIRTYIVRIQGDNYWPIVLLYFLCTGTMLPFLQSFGKLPSFK